MPDLDLELAHLRLADEHIAKARVLLAEAADRAKSGVGPETLGAGDSLEAMTESLGAFESHRTLILQTIADIRAGKL